MGIRLYARVLVCMCVRAYMFVYMFVARVCAYVYIHARYTYIKNTRTQCLSKQFVLLPPLLVEADILDVAWVYILEPGNLCG